MTVLSFKKLDLEDDPTLDQVYAYLKGERKRIGSLKNEFRVRSSVVFYYLDLFDYLFQYFKDLKTNMSKHIITLQDERNALKSQLKKVRDNFDKTISESKVLFKFGKIVILK